MSHVIPVLIFPIKFSLDDTIADFVALLTTVMTQPKIVSLPFHFIAQLDRRYNAHILFNMGDAVKREKPIVTPERTLRSIHPGQHPLKKALLAFTPVGGMK